MWINPTTDAPDLADFVIGATEADALSHVPEDAQLVRDEGRGAWFSLLAGKLVPLIGGDVGGRRLDQPRGLPGRRIQRAAVRSCRTSGLIGGGILIGASALAIAGLLVIPTLVRQVRASSGYRAHRPARSLRRRRRALRESWQRRRSEAADPAFVEAKLILGATVRLPW